MGADQRDEDRALGGGPRSTQRASGPARRHAPKHGGAGAGRVDCDEGRPACRCWRSSRPRSAWSTRRASRMLPARSAWRWARTTSARTPACRTIRWRSRTCARGSSSHPAWAGCPARSTGRRRPLRIEGSRPRRLRVDDQDGHGGQAHAHARDDAGHQRRARTVRGRASLGARTARGCSEAAAARSQTARTCRAWRVRRRSWSSPTRTASGTPDGSTLTPDRPLATHAFDPRGAAPPCSSSV